MQGRTIGTAVKYNTTSVWESLLIMTREEGFKGLFKGNGTNVLRIAPYSGVQFLAFESYKDVRS
jgi:solute carrier family 25 phosphate transporter 23/24/25/41